MILIVEDDPQVAQLIALVLQRHGDQCEIVADGRTALSRARELQPSIIFADLTLKGMGGAALCAALRAQPETKSIPYIIEFEDLVRLVEKYAGAESRKAD